MNLKRELPPTPDDRSAGALDSAILPASSPTSSESEKIIEISLAGSGAITISGTSTTSAQPAEFDFKAQGNLSDDFPGNYLRQYYGLSRPVTDDETAVYEFIQQMATQHLTGNESCLEIGCGPTVHHAIMLAPFVAQMTLADYLESNLAYINAWKDQTKKAWDWSRYTAFCIERDGGTSTPEKIASREELTRNNIVATLPINILNDHPLGYATIKFDVVSAFYCTEEVALDVPRWQQVMTSVASLIADNGYLLMSCLYNSDFYHIVSEEGEVQELPCAKIDQETLRSTLEKLDFNITTDSIRLVRTPEQEAEGVPGILLVFAQKRISTNDLT